MEPLGFFGRQGDGLYGPLHLSPAFCNYLAFFHGDSAGQVFRPFPEQIRGSAEDGVAVIGGHFAHHLCAAGGAGDGLLHFSGVGPWDCVDDRLVKGVEHGHGFGFIHPLAADVHFH